MGPGGFPTCTRSNICAIRSPIVAVCDVEPAAAKRRGWGVPRSRVFSGLDDLLAFREVDLVEILLPHRPPSPA